MPCLIVISTNQDDLGIQRVTKCGQRVMQAGAECDTAVVEITYDREVIHSISFHKLCDAIQVGLRFPFRDGDSMGAKGGGFPEMDIGQHQGAACGPENGTSREKHEILACETDPARSRFRNGGGFHRLRHST